MFESTKMRNKNLCCIICTFLGGLCFIYPYLIYVSQANNLQSYYDNLLDAQCKFVSSNFKQINGSYHFQVKVKAFYDDYELDFNILYNSQSNITNSEYYKSGCDVIYQINNDQMHFIGLEYDKIGVKARLDYYNNACNALLFSMIGCFLLSIIAVVIFMRQDNKIEPNDEAVEETEISEVSRSVSIA